MRKGRFAVASAVGVMVGAAIVTTAPAAAATAPRPVAVSVVIKGFAAPPYALSRKRFKKGKTYRIAIRNADFSAHDWVVFRRLANGRRGPRVLRSRVLAEGQRQVKQVRFSRPGTYVYICSIEGHASVMKGTFRVIR